MWLEGAHLDNPEYFSFLKELNPHYIFKVPFAIPGVIFPGSKKDCDMGIFGVSYFAYHTIKIVFWL